MKRIKKLIVLFLLLPSLNCLAVTVRTYKSVTEMVSDKTIKNGDVLETINYYDYINGGGGRYIVAKTADDNDFTVNLKNGLCAILQHDNNVNVLQLGVKNDQSQDCSSIINRAIEKLAVKGGTLFFPIGIYLVSQIKINNPVILRGDESSYWNQGTMFFCHSKEDMVIIDAQNVRIENIFFVGNQYDNTAIKAVGSQNRSGLHINNVHINKFKTGIYTDKFFLSRVNNSRCANCETGICVSNATSFFLQQCWTLVCGTGYSINKSTYVEMMGCCSDECEIGYNLISVKGIELHSCACEVSKKIPLYISDNSVATINNFVGYKNNKFQYESTSLVYAENSVVTLTGCCDRDKYIDPVSKGGCTNTVKTVNSLLTIQGCNFSGLVSKDKKSSAIGSYYKNGKIVIL